MSGPYFKFNRDECLLRLCKEPGNYAHIRNNLWKWKLSRDIKHWGQMVNAPELVGNAKLEEELLKIL